MKLKKVVLCCCLPLITMVSCQNDTKSNENFSERVVLMEQLNQSKKELFSSVSKSANPIKALMHEMELSSKFSRSDLEEDMRLSFSNLQENVKLISVGELTYEEYFQDVNGAFKKNAAFKTDLGKMISLYFANKFNENMSSPEFAKSKEYQNFREIQNIKTKLNEN